MFPIRTKNRKAISAVLTTIIILVASIVLGTGVVIFSTGLFQSGGQQQAVQIQGLKGWVNGTNSTGVSWGAFAVKNIGDKLVAVNSITLRGAAVPYANWFAATNQSQASQNFQSQLISTGTDITGYMRSNMGYQVTGDMASPYTSATCPTPAAYRQLTTSIIIDENANPDTIVATGGTVTQPGYSLCLIQQSGPVSLLPGNIAIIYFKNPTGLYGTTDTGVTSTISVLAGTAPVAQTVRLGNT